jgi:hypothetical protein
MRIALFGPGISPVTVTAVWQPKTGTFGAKIAIPAKARKAVNYAITVRENVGTGLVVARSSVPCQSGDHPLQLKCAVTRAGYRLI